MAPIASIITLRRGVETSSFGAVVFTLSDRTDINSLHDLVGGKVRGHSKTCMAQGRPSQHDLWQIVRKLQRFQTMPETNAFMPFKGNHVYEAEACLPYVKEPRHKN